VRYCAGIDGGQSSTVCAIGDERGTVLARASGAPADLVGEPRGSARQANVLDTVLADALGAAGLAPETTLAAIVAGLSGYDEGHSSRPELQTPHEAFVVLHDAEIAHAGAFEGAPGILVIAGTGSVAFGTNEEGTRARAGGWGFQFGDEGSAFWIAREAIAHAMRDEDFSSPPGLGPLAMVHFGAPSLRALQHGVAHGEITRAMLAAFAPAVLAAARDGDRNAGDIRSEAAAKLARLVHMVHRRLGSSRKLAIAPCGGVFADADLLDHWKWAMRALEPAATIVKAKSGGATGALRLAYRVAGIDVGSLAEAGA
jgi:N-acetylglucosamine kinase-like BadF-type ATPase